MNVVYLIRHSWTNENKIHLIQGRQDYKLCEEGISFAYEKAKEYKEKGLEFDYIYSSPLSRALDTAKIFKEVFNFPKDIIIDQGLIEREFGEAEKTIIDDKVYERIMNNEIKGMETNEELEERVYNAINNIVSKYDNKRILIVTHSHTIKGMLCYLDERIRMESYLRNVTITTLKYSDNKYEIIDYNKYADEGDKWKI